MPYKKTFKAVKTRDTDGKDSSAADLAKSTSEFKTDVNDAVPSGTLRSMFQKRNKAANKALKG
jgi:hypothetical protein